MNEPLVEARGIVVRYRTPHGTLRAVDGVDLAWHEGETLALVGESGCGKSSLARALVGLEPLHAGSLRVRGGDARRPLQLVFQDPTASLDPRLRAGAQVDEALRLGGLRDGRERAARIARLFEEVGLGAELLARMPHELSGGQRQRVCIARALAARPRGLICDEAVSALDVSVRAQILNLLATLQERHGLALLVVSHDLALVRHLARRVAVMYLGQIVEQAPVDALFETPAHPYTQLLLSAARGRSAALDAQRDEPPSLLAPPAGCRFHPRCPRAEPRCSREVPRLAPRNDGHVRCGVAVPAAFGDPE